MKQIPPIIKMQRGKYSRSQVLILGIYFLLALAMTYPLITNLCAVPASSGDKYQFIWNIWWINKCLLEGKNVFNIDYLFYPHAFSGVFHTFALTPVLLTVPAYHLLGVIANYNLIILLGFWLSAFFCYQLVCYLTDSTRAGFIAGIIYGFNPIHTRAAYEGGYLNFAFDALVPLFVLAFITFFDKRRVKYIAYSAILYSAIVYTGYQLAVYTAIIGAILFIFYFFQRERERERESNSQLFCAYYSFCIYRIRAMFSDYFICI